MRRRSDSSPPPRSRRSRSRRPIGAPGPSYDGLPARRRRPRTASAASARWRCRTRCGARTPGRRCSTYAIAPGVTFEQFTLTGVRGVTRGQLVRVDPATPGVGLDLVSGRNVASRHVVADMMDPNAVVGVNGDFFDIRDTEAPLGVARDRQRGILNGVQSGWNSAFWVDSAGVPHIGDLYADAVLRQRPTLDVTNVNSPSVPSGGIGLYTEKWGTLRKYRVVDGQRRGVRMVVIRSGRVVSNRSRFPGVAARAGHGAGRPGFRRGPAGPAAGRAAADCGRRPLAGRRDGDHRQPVPAPRRRTRWRRTTATCTRGPRSGSTATPASSCCWSSTGGRTSAADRR